MSIPAPSTTIGIEVLEISWHKCMPVFSVDYSPHLNRLATGGGDRDVKIWQVNWQELCRTVLNTLPSANKEPNPKDTPKRAIDLKRERVKELAECITFKASLSMHDRTVNIVRFAPGDSDLLASASDDGVVAI